MSMFDVNTFLNAETTEAGSTTVIQVPPGEYKGVVKSLEARSFEGKDGNQRVVLDLTWELVDVNPEVIEEVGRDTLTVRQTIWIDLTSQGQFDMSRGKNISLNQVRDAVGQNVGGQPWRPGNLIGAGPALLVVSHRPDKNDPERVYAEVKRVGKLTYSNT